MLRASAAGDPEAPGRAPRQLDLPAPRQLDHSASRHPAGKHRLVLVITIMLTFRVCCG